MNVWRYWSAVLIVTSIFSTAAFAAEETSNLKISGKLWTRFLYDNTSYPTTSTAVNKNGFDIYRAYFIANYKYDENWSAFLLYDATRSLALSSTATLSGGTSMWSYVKDLYVQRAGIFETMTFRFGYMPTPYDIFIDPIAGTRWLTTNLNDSGNLTPSHAGGTAISGKAFNRINWIAMVHNGAESTTAAGNNDNGLAGIAGIDVNPFSESENALKKLGMTVVHEYMAPARSSVTAGVTEGYLLFETALHYQSTFFDGTLEYVQQQVNGQDLAAGYGFFANIKFLGDEKWSIFTKYYTGNTQFENVNLIARSAMTIGPTYTFLKDKVMTAILYDVKPTTPRIAAGAGAPDAVTLSWNWAANF